MMMSEFKPLNVHQILWGNNSASAPCIMPMPPSSTFLSIPKPVEKTGRWTKEEHKLFLEGLAVHGKAWRKIARSIKTRSVIQVRTHAQKYFMKMYKSSPAELCNGSNVAFDKLPSPLHSGGGMPSITFDKIGNQISNGNGDGKRGDEFNYGLPNTALLNGCDVLHPSDVLLQGMGMSTYHSTMHGMHAQQQQQQLQSHSHMTVNTNTSTLTCTPLPHEGNSLHNNNNIPSNNVIVRGLSCISSPSSSCQYSTQGYMGSGSTSPKCVWELSRKPSIDEDLCSNNNSETIILDSLMNTNFLSTELEIDESFKSTLPTSLSPPQEIEFNLSNMSNVDDVSNGLTADIAEFLNGLFDTTDSLEIAIDTTIQDLSNKRKRDAEENNQMNNSCITANTSYSSFSSIDSNDNQSSSSNSSISSTDSESESDYSCSHSKYQKRFDILSFDFVEKDYDFDMNNEDDFMIYST
eukprot:gene6145-12450_t